MAAHLRTIAGATLRGMLIAIRDQSRPAGTRRRIAPPGLVLKVEASARNVQRPGGRRRHGPQAPRPGTTCGCWFIHEVRLVTNSLRCDTQLSARASRSEGLKK